MKLTIKHKTLLDAVALADKLVMHKATIPMLHNVRIVADQTGVKLTATDLDAELTVALRDSPRQAFDYTVPCKSLLNALKAMNDEFVHLESFEAENVKLTIGSVAVFLPTLPVADWPTLDYINKGKSITLALPAQTFMAALDSVAFAISSEETRYYLNGVYFHGVKENKNAAPIFHLVATDGTALGFAPMSNVMYPNKLPNVIVPRLTIGLLQKAWATVAKVKPTPETIGCDVSARRVQFSFGNVTIVSKVIDGTFPDYARVIPRHNGNVAKIDKALLAISIKQLIGLCGKTKYGNMVQINFGPKCTIAMRNQDTMQLVILPLCAVYAPDDKTELTMGFNANYVLALCDVVEAKALQLDLNGALSPTLVRDAVKPDWQGVIMPMRI